MYIRKKIARPLVVLLTISQCMTAVAGVWVSKTPTEWSYQNDDGMYQTGGWFQDPADERWYYLNESGVMSFGWKLLNDHWYFLNMNHDGAFGARVTSEWQWIDGYCYYFGADGRLCANAVTPDGFTVNTVGQWMENDSPVYIAGKGIVTTESTGASAQQTTRSSSGGSSTGGGGGGGSSYTYYDYKILYVDENGTVLAVVSGEAKKNAFINIPIKEIGGYTYVGGQSGQQKLTVDDMVFVLNYQRNETEDPAYNEDDATPDIGESKEVYTYKVVYQDMDTGNAIKEITGSGKRDTTITVSSTVAGYDTVSGNQYSFLLSEDEMVVTLLYSKTVESFKYTIRYLGTDGEKLGEIESLAFEGSRVDIPERYFDGYSKKDDQDASFVLNNNNMVVKIYYIQDIVEDDDATPTDAGNQKCSYTVKYIDKDTQIVLLRESRTAEAGTVLTPEFEFDGYEYASDYAFEVIFDGAVFTVYLVKAAEEDDVTETTYTVTCVDEDGNELKVYHGKVSVLDALVIYPEYEIDGYEMVGNNEFVVEKSGLNFFILEFQSIKKLIYTIECIDIDTLQKIEDIMLRGNVGDALSVSDICPEGYESVGNPPSTVKVSANEANNSTKIYFKKTSEKTDIVKEAAYTIQFRAYKDQSTYIVNDLTGTWTVGEKIPVYFIREFTDKEGKQWQAIDDSPRIFSIKDQEMNTFLIEFQNIGELEKEEDERIYSIRYIADDTKSILGITTGIGDVGDIIPYRNTFDDYGFMKIGNSYTITDAETNTVDVLMERVNFPGHDVNQATGLYDGYEWIVLFVDSNGEQLLPSVNGFTVDGDKLYVDYPDVIEKGGVTYRAENASPLKELVKGTVYHQYIIQYITGDPSEDKLESWKSAAQKKKDAFYGTTPYSYYLAYKEKSSWNDIALKFGVANAGTEIEIECETVDGWVVPQEYLGNFALDENGKIVTAQYERSDNGTSMGYNQREYTINFVDTAGNNLFDPYTGFLAFVKGNSTCDFMVYHPNSFYDDEGNRWESDKDSPQTFVMSALDRNVKEITYHQVYENEKEQFIVESNADVNRILNDFAIHTYDAARHEFYVIGRDYNPNTVEVSNTMYMNDLAGYTNEVVNTFELNGVTYTICLIGYYHKWNQETCTHEWEYVEELQGNCLTAAHQVVKCKKCNKEVTTIVPAVGHVDENYDSVCDECGVRLKQNLGDEITLQWDSGSLGFGVRSYDFVCIDTDYQGTGKMLYICESDIKSDIYGTYTTADSADYGSSSVRYFLDDQFANGLSVSGALQSIDGDVASMLTKAEYDQYRTARLNNFAFPSGTYLTKGDDMNVVILTNGTTVSAKDADNYAIRPTLLMNRSEEEEGVRTGIWNVDDMQVREIGDKLYLFRCVDANYTDKSNTDKSMALFLCDTVIAANEGLGFDEADSTQSTRFFGATNNYKYSAINDWLNENKSKTGNLLMTNIGIVNEYSGTTETGKFQSLDVKSLTRFTRDTAQVMYSNLFIPSVEEAIEMKDYLWKFNGSDKNNASDIINNYRESYWLRTPQYDTDDMVYTVNLRTGVIEPKSVKKTSENTVSNAGIRPMYVVEQAY